MRQRQTKRDREGEIGFGVSGGISEPRIDQLVKWHYLAHGRARLCPLRMPLSLSSVPSFRFSFRIFIYCLRFLLCLRCRFCLSICIYLTLHRNCKFWIFHFFLFCFTGIVFRIRTRAGLSSFLSLFFFVCLCRRVCVSI